MHTLNDQVFRGFFTGRYIFDSVTGFLRYASPAASGGFGPRTVGCPNGVYVTAPDPCPGGGTPTNGPLLLYLQGASLSGPATDATGASKIANEEFALFVQDQWQPVNGLTVNFGLRWDAQLMPETIDPRSTAYGAFLSDPAFPSDGTIPDQWDMVQPRAGVAWDINGAGKYVVRASDGIYCGATEHALAGRIGDDQRRAAAVAVRQHRAAERVRRDDPDLAGSAGRSGGCAGTVPALQRRARLPQGLREPAHLRLQHGVRAGADARLRRLRGLHLERRTSADAVPELQPQRAVVLRGRPGHREHLRLQRFTVGACSSAR